MKLLIAPLPQALASQDRRQVILKVGSIFTNLLPFFTLVILSILANGYHFGVSDQTEQLPLIFRLINPDYLANDWFVNHNHGFNVRFFYSLFLATLNRLIPLEFAFLSLYLLSLTLLCISAYLFTRSILDETGAGLLGVSFILYNRSGSLGGSQLSIPLLVPSILAFGLSLSGAYLLFRRKTVASLLLFFLASLIHPLVGPEIALLCVFALFFSTAKTERFHRWKDYLAITIISLGLMLGTELIKGGVQVDRGEVIRILTSMRSPWHYLPFTWEWPVWQGFLSFALIALLARIHSKGTLFLDWLSIGTVLFFLIGSLAFIGDPFLDLIKLQPFRLSVLLQFVGALYLAAYFWQLLSSPYSGVRIAVILFMIAALLAQRLSSNFLPKFTVALLLFEALQLIIHRLNNSGQYIKKQRILPWLSIIPALWLLFPVVGDIHGSIFWKANWPYAVIVGVTLLLVLQHNQRGTNHLQKAGQLAPVLACLSVGILLIWGSWVDRQFSPWIGRFLEKVHPHLSYSTSFDRVALWAKTNTPVQAIFIVPPYTEDFRLKAERAIVADFKAFPFNNLGPIEWRDRMYALSGGQQLSLGNDWYNQLKNSYNTLDVEVYNRLADQYDAGFVLIDTSQLLELPIVYENEDYRLYRVPR